MYIQNSLRPARAKQSIPIILIIAPPNEVQMIVPYVRVYWLKESDQPTALKAAIMIALPVVDSMSPPGFNTKNHMDKQKPPTMQPKPSVTSLNTRDIAPNMRPVATAATKYAPCIASLTGGDMTYMMRTVIDKLARYAALKKTRSHLCLIPMIA